MLDQLACAQRALRGAKAVGLSRVELADATKGIGRLRSRLAALEADVATAVAGLDDKVTDPEDQIRSQSKQSRRKARQAARRARGLEDMPNTKSAAPGRWDLTEEHVDSLIDAAEKTSFADVDGDKRLLDDAASRPADLAAKDIRDWISRHRRAKSDEERQRRQRFERRLSVWTDQDGMIVLHGVFDPVSGMELKRRIDAETERLYHTDGGPRRRPSGQNPRSNAEPMPYTACSASPTPQSRRRRRTTHRLATS